MDVFFFIILTCNQKFIADTHLTINELKQILSNS